MDNKEKIQCIFYEKELLFLKKSSDIALQVTVAWQKGGKTHNYFMPLLFFRFLRVIG